jgi:hypothetical protein
MRVLDHCVLLELSIFIVIRALKGICVFCDSLLHETILEPIEWCVYICGVGSAQKRAMYLKHST